MKNKVKLILSLLILITASCEWTGSVEPNEIPKPPGYQEDIPWPSLADSPWPMSHHDPQSTGRSNLEGPITGSIEWEYSEQYEVSTGVVIDTDSIIYTVAVGLLALNNSGERKWIIPYGGVNNYTGPLITKAGNIIWKDGSSPSIIYLTSPDGSTLWTFEADGHVSIESINIDKNGNFYFVDDDKKLYALSSNGILLWSIIDERINKWATFHLTFSPDGNTLYIPGYDVTVLALDINEKTILWTYGDERLKTNAMVDSDGNVYTLVNSGLKSLSQDGKLRWEYNFSELQSINDNSPCIDKYGNIYFATDTLYSVDYKGILRWKKELPRTCDAPLVCDNNGNVYCGTAQQGVSILAYNSEGVNLWQIDQNDQIFVGSSPAIDYNDVLYYPIYPNKIIAIK